jgi:cation transport protein ChaC
MTDQPPAWLFAYGSLIWRPDFAYRERTRGFVRGWSRRFWQGSTDHRGVPGAPGRVVTLTPDPAQACWGVAYRLDAETLQATLRATDVRERGGYERHSVEFHAADGERAGSWAALMYVAAPHNPNYLGPASLDSIAEQVRRARGPSGANLEYVFELHRVLVELGVADPHVASLAALLLDGSAPAPLERNTPAAPQSRTEQRAASAEPERSLTAAQR